MPNVLEREVRMKPIQKSERGILLACQTGEVLFGGDNAQAIAQAQFRKVAELLEERGDYLGEDFNGLFLDEENWQQMRKEAYERANYQTDKA